MGVDVVRAAMHWSHQSLMTGGNLTCFQMGEMESSQVWRRWRKCASLPGVVCVFRGKTVATLGAVTGRVASLLVTEVSAVTGPSRTGPSCSNESPGWSANSRKSKFSDLQTPTHGPVPGRRDAAKTRRRP